MKLYKPIIFLLFLISISNLIIEDCIAGTKNFHQSAWFYNNIVSFAERATKSILEWEILDQFTPDMLLLFRDHYFSLIARW